MKHKVLFLASWYPSKILPQSGIFVKRHAEAVANFCDVAVLHVMSDPNLNDKKIEIETKNEKNVFTVKVFYKDDEGCNAASQVRNGVRVLSKMVPAVTELWCWQAGHIRRVRLAR